MVGKFTNGIQGIPRNTVGILCPSIWPPVWLTWILGIFWLLHIQYIGLPPWHTHGQDYGIFFRDLCTPLGVPYQPEWLEGIFWGIPENFRVIFLGKIQLTPRITLGNTKFCTQGVPLLTQREIKRYPKYDQMITQKTPNNIVAMLINIFIELPLVRFLQALKNLQSLQ